MRTINDNYELKQNYKWRLACGKQEKIYILKQKILNFNRGKSQVMSTMKKIKSSHI